MRILQVHNEYQRYGGEDAVLQIESQLLNSNGHQVNLLSKNNNSISGWMPKLRAAITIGYSDASREEMKFSLDKHKPDIVHVHNFFPLLTPSIYDACIDVGVPVVQTLHNYRTICPGALLMRNGNVCEDCVIGSPYHAVLYGCYRGSRAGSMAVARMVQMHRKRETWLKKVDRFIALTNFSKKKFVKAGFPEDKITVKPNFMALDNAGEMLPDVDEPHALFVGRLSQEKGIETLLQAWQQLSLPLFLVGDGPLLDSVFSVKPSSIVSLGHMSSEDVRKKMMQASFLVMPSVWYEGFPMVLVEAFAHALPVLTSRLGGMAEIVEDGKTGLHFEAGNSSDLVEKVKWLQNHPEVCRKMGKNARQVYLEKYTPETNYRILMKIYDKAIIDHV